MMYPLVDELADDGFPVSVTCGVLGFSTQGFYKWKRRPVCDRDWDDAHLVNVIRDVHADDPEFGYRLISDELERAGHVASENRVHRLCLEHKVWSTTVNKGRKGSGKTPGPAVHDDLIERDFTAAGPDQLWFADFTYLRCWEGVVFFSFVIDAYSRQIVGWQFASPMRTDLVLDALRMSLAVREPGADVQLVHHSDAGSQYTSFDYAQALDDHGVLASIGTVGDAYDNAMAESFVDSFKTELIRDRVWRTRSQLELAIVEYVAWFNTERLHTSLGGIPPAEYEEVRQRL